MPDFLLEIGLEEIPARMIDAAREELKRRVRDLLVRERLVVARDPKNPKVVVTTREDLATKFDEVVADAEGPEIETFSTPRRLALVARGITASQPDVEEQITGPSTKVAY